MSSRVWLVSAMVGTALVAACGPARLHVPSGPWAPQGDALPIFTDVSRACRGVRTMSVELAVSGRVAGSRLRGRLLAGFERPGRLRLEALAPFGAPVFVLTARENRAVLVLPRERHVLRDVPVEEVLGVLTGVRRNADDLLALLTGCVTAVPEPAGGSRNEAGWLSFAVGRGVDVFVRRAAGDWRIVGGAEAEPVPDQPGWLIEYDEFRSSFPDLVRLSQRAQGGSPQQAPTALTLRVSQRDINITIDPAAFDAAVPPGSTSITLGDLQRREPLAETQAPPRRHP
jgi:hypothetical protein